MHITLVHGRVQVNQGARQVVLRPGDDAQPTNKYISVHQMDTDNYTSWREGLIFYDDVTLRDILLQLGRWYNLNIICTNPDVLDKHFHYIYDRNADVKNTLQTLTESSNVGIELKDQTLDILLSGIRVVIVYSYTAAPEVYDLSASRMGTPTQVKANSIGESLIGST